MLQLYHRKTMLHAIIMAGGSGTRLWPESRANCPKQLLAIGSKQTLIQQSVLRLMPLVEQNRIYVATNPRLGAALLESINKLPDIALSDSALILEPIARNTTACIGLAAVRCLNQDSDATMAIMTSDHRIEPIDDFADNVRFAVDLVEKNPKRLVTFGIRPTYPSESFGYIRRGTPNNERFATTKMVQQAFRVEQFKEKPNRQTAEEYLRSGLYYWNSGMFVWKARTILDRIKEYQPDMGAAFDRIAAHWDFEDRDAVIKQEFTAIRSISIDYAVMERAPEVFVVEANFDWDDVGSWGALERLETQDGNGNTISCPHSIALQTSGTIIRSQDPNHLIALVGVKDLAVIHTPTATLIINKRDEQAVRKVVLELNQTGQNDWL